MPLRCSSIGITFAYSSSLLRHLSCSVWGIEKTPSLGGNDSPSKRFPLNDDDVAQWNERSKSLLGVSMISNYIPNDKCEDRRYTVSP